MPTYTPIQSAVLTSNTSSFTISGIPQNYTDLLVVARMQQTAANNATMTFNGSSSGYSNNGIARSGGSAVSWRLNDKSYMFIDYYSGPTSSGSTTFQQTYINILNYSSTSGNKTALIKSGHTGASPEQIVGMWANTSAIISITFQIEISGNIAAGSSFDVYGIKSGAPFASGGDIITTDGSYWYHAFKTSGTFIPIKNLTTDCLVVAGGGAGGYANGSSSGGGGAGGLRGLTSQSLSSGTAYTVTVGGGGSSISSPSYGGKGTNSSFSGNDLTTITATGGGGGGGINDNGQAGGSGGGGSNNNLTGGTGNQGGYSPVEGYAGGSGASNGSASGGGGGATAVGGNANAGTGTAGAGGAGSSSYSSWGSATFTGQNVSSTYYYAGGGGGGGNTANSGGSGGGGAGGHLASGTAGTVNTGGGGGGSQGTPIAGASGGSGIVIVRYPV